MKMTDELCETLILAARAGGIKGLSIAKGGGVWADLGKKLKSHWNPYTNNGDAFDLALRGKLDVDIRTLVVSAEPLGTHTGAAAIEACANDHEARSAAARLAIVRAMADIQRRKECPPL